MVFGEGPVFDGGFYFPGQTPWILSGVRTFGWLIFPPENHAFATCLQTDL